MIAIDIVSLIGGALALYTQKNNLSKDVLQIDIYLV